MISVVYGGRTVWEFSPHRVAPGVVETQAQKAPPPIPPQAALFTDEGMLGFVTAVKPTKMERWLVSFEGGDGGPGVALVTVEVDLSEVDLPADAVVTLTGEPVVGVEAEVDAIGEGEQMPSEADLSPAGGESDDAPFLEGQPISTMRGLLTASAWAAVASIADTVEDVIVLSDRALLDVDGIGPKSLEAIRSACVSLLGDNA